MKHLLAIVIICSSLIAFAQQDSLIIDSSTTIVGEIKLLEKGVITIETDYSDSDFKIELEKIKKNKALSSLPLIKQSRLSVMPIDYKSWKIIYKMGKIR